jgi:hypothetical protein
LRSESPCSIEKVQEAFPAAPAVVVALVRGGYSLGNKGVKYAAKFAESPDKKLFGKKVFLFKSKIHNNNYIQNILKNVIKILYMWFLLELFLSKKLLIRKCEEDHP